MCDGGGGGGAHLQVVHVLALPAVLLLRGQGEVAKLWPHRRLPVSDGLHELDPRVERVVGAHVAAVAELHALEKDRVADGDHHPRLVPHGSRMPAPKRPSKQGKNEGTSFEGVDYSGFIILGRLFSEAEVRRRRSEEG